MKKYCNEDDVRNVVLSVGFHKINNPVKKFVFVGGVYTACNVWHHCIY